jgi:hypothetical protein
MLAPVANAQLDGGIFDLHIFTDGTPALASEVNANFSGLADALDVTVPNSFANSGIADANLVNDNFDVLKTAVDTFTTDLAAATSATDTAFNNGSVQGAASVDITTDNAAAEAVATAAAGSAACTQADGTWDAGTSTCTPAYNCFIGGFCAQAALDFPPGDFGYTNVYVGDTPGTEPALGAGCNSGSRSFSWTTGAQSFISLPPSSSISMVNTAEGGICASSL